MAGLRSHMLPLASTAQDSAALPWVRWREVKHVIANTLPVALEQLKETRVLLRVLLLVRPYLPKRDLMHFWEAQLAKPAAKAYSKLFHMIPEMLFHGHLEGCDLTMDFDPETQVTFLHPACQCGTRPQRAPGAVLLARGGHGDVTESSSVKLACGSQEVIKCPWYVAKTLYSAALLRESANCKNLFSERVRWQKLPWDLGKAPKRLCKIPSLIVKTCGRIEEGLDAGMALLAGLRTELKSAFLEQRGFDKLLTDTWEAASVAFWIPDIFESAEPRDDHVKACQKLFELLLPDLQFTLWPEAAWGMTPAVKKWPTMKGMAVMYKRWWKLLHTEASDAASEFQKYWLRTRSFEVRPVVLHAAVASMRSARQFQGLPFWFSIAVHIEGFLSKSPASFTARSDELRPLPWSIKTGNPIKVGQFCSMLPKHVRHKLVLVSAVNMEIDQKRIAKDIEQDRRFSQNCWHVARMFHRVRRMVGAEAPCESWVGELKYLWNPIHGPSTGLLADRLQLRLAGVRGSLPRCLGLV